MKIRDYQYDLAEKGCEILHKHKMLFLTFEQRVGKTATAFLTIRNHAKNYLHFNAKPRVIFVTDKKVIPEAIKDFEAMATEKLNFRLFVTNYHQLHKLLVNKKDNDFNYYIIDECQTLGAFPKPNLRTRQLQELVGNKMVIYLSGTPTPESYSQVYHQCWISDHSPFNQWPSFYKWVNAGFVNKKHIRITGRFINDYSEANIDKILPYINPLMLSYTRAEAGFEQTDAIDLVRWVPIDPMIHKLVKKLLKDRYYKFNKLKGELIADTAVSLSQKIHQLYSGTIIATDLEEVNPDGSPVKHYHILDESKAKYIKSNYKGKRIAIYYKYQSELEVLKKYFNITDDQFKFNKSKGTDLVFATQFRSGYRGINISSADCIIAYNIDFSYEVYSQFRQRCSAKDRVKAPEIHWLFSQGGIEENIYLRVLEKTPYTSVYFKEDYMSKKDNATKEQKLKGIATKNAIYNLTTQLMTIENSDEAMIDFLREKFLETGLLEQKDFDNAGNVVQIYEGGKSAY